MNHYFHLTKKSLRVLMTEDSKIMGYIYLSKIEDSIWEVKTIVAEHGLGYIIFEHAMNLIFEDYIIPYRGEHINLDLENIYNKFGLRPDIVSEELDKNSHLYRNLNIHNYWYNKKYRLKERIPLITYELMKYEEIHGKGLSYFLSKYKLN